MDERTRCCEHQCNFYLRNKLCGQIWEEPACNKMSENKQSPLKWAARDMVSKERSTVQLGPRDKTEEAGFLCQGKEKVSGEHSTMSGREGWDRETELLGKSRVSGKPEDTKCSSGEVRVTAA